MHRPPVFAAFFFCGLLLLRLCALFSSTCSLCIIFVDLALWRNEDRCACRICLRSVLYASLVSRACLSLSKSARLCGHMPKHHWWRSLTFWSSGLFFAASERV
ncbi:unnamed protein product [Ixodes persulcatus]